MSLTSIAIGSRYTSLVKKGSSRKTMELRTSLRLLFPSRLYDALCVSCVLGQLRKPFDRLAVLRVVDAVGVLCTEFLELLDRGNVLLVKTQSGMTCSSLKGFEPGCAPHMKQQWPRQMSFTNRSLLKNRILPLLSRIDPSGVFVQAMMKANPIDV
jgi:hypothetical protein